MSEAAFHVHLTEKERDLRKGENPDMSMRLTRDLRWLSVPTSINNSLPHRLALQWEEMPRGFRAPFTARKR
jgi:hypothetical protein